MKRNFAALLVFLTLIVHCSAALAQDKKTTPQGFQIGKDPQVQQIKPKKPLRIKLHRNSKGEYSWDITGDNVDDIIRADGRLRKQLKLE